MSIEQLTETSVDPDPIEQFARWFETGSALDIVDPNAMTLATATPDGKPSARIVLLKGFDQHGFTFFSNYGSRKGRELEENPQAALILYWGSLRRQIRIEGIVERVPLDESDRYFASRPRGSQIAALASKQSAVIESRESLEQRVGELSEQLADSDVPRPDYWGGYRLRPESLEFWQGQRDRLHDRIQYRRDGEGHWLRERLSP